MGQFVPIAVVLFVAAACSDPSSTPNPPSEAAAMDGILVPAPVLAMARQYADALPGPEDRQAVRRAYVDGFFDGLQQPDGPGLFDPARPQHRANGYRAAQDYRRTHAEQLDDLMRGYGYTPTVATGEYVLGFELSVLRPREHAQQRWWVDWMAAIDLAPASEPRTEPPRSMLVRVEGYLSPAGRHGHLGEYDHRLLAKTIVPLTGR